MFIWVILPWSMFTCLFQMFLSFFQLLHIDVFPLLLIFKWGHFLLKQNWREPKKKQVGLKEISIWNTCWYLLTKFSPTFSFFAFVLIFNFQVGVWPSTLPFQIHTLWDVHQWFQLPLRICSRPLSLRGLSKRRSTAYEEPFRMLRLRVNTQKTLPVPKISQQFQVFITAFNWGEQNFILEDLVFYYLLLVFLQLEEGAYSIFK